MNIEVYCDESRQEFFARAGASLDAYTLIGSLWIDSENRKEYIQQIKGLRKRHNYNHEFKWTKVGLKNLGFFTELVQMFFKAPDMKFRCIVLPAKDLSAVRFHESDNELMFYKFYYQVLHHWILDGNNYRIYLDLKTNRSKNRLRVLHKCLSNANLLADIKLVQALPSREVELIQLVDVLVGAVGYRFHNLGGSKAKLLVQNEIERHLKHPIIPTHRNEPKFNIFLFRPGGGW